MHTHTQTAHISPGEGKKLIVHITLHLLLIVHSRTLFHAEVHDLTKVCVQVSSSVIVGPKGFPISPRVNPVIVAIEGLFCAIVDDWDTL